VKKLPTFRPSLVTREFFPEYDDVSVINEGECFIWAYAAYLLFKDIELWYTPHHAFVKYHGRFYDSERLRGVEHWQDLPAAGRGFVPLQDRSIEAFKAGWDHPERFNTSWRKIERHARKVLRREQASI
jgi:hypothetical protein